MLCLSLSLISYSMFTETDMIIPAKGLSFNEAEPSKEKNSIIISLEIPEQLYLLGGIFILLVQICSYIYTAINQRLFSGPEAACHGRVWIHMAELSCPFLQWTGLLAWQFPAWWTLEIPWAFSKILAVGSGQNCTIHLTVWKTTAWNWLVVLNP